MINIVILIDITTQINTISTRSKPCVRGAWPRRNYQYTNLPNNFQLLHFYSRKMHIDFHLDPESAVGISYIITRTNITSIFYVISASIHITTKIRRDLDQK